MPFRNSLAAAFLEVYGAGKRIVIDAASGLGAALMFYMGYPYNNMGPGTEIPETETNVAALLVTPTDLPNLGRKLEIRSPLFEADGFGAVTSGNRVTLWSDEFSPTLQTYIGLETAPDGIVYVTTSELYLGNSGDVLGPWDSLGLPAVACGGTFVTKTGEVRVMQIGKTVDMSFNLLTTSNGTAGYVELTLPIPARAPWTNRPFPIGHCWLASGAYLGDSFAFLQAGGTVVRFIRTDTAAGDYIGVDPATTLPSGASLRGTLRYEAA